MRDILDAKHAKPLPVAMEKIILDRYKWQRKTEEFIAEKVSDAILDKYLFDGKCNNFVKKLSPTAQETFTMKYHRKGYLAGLFK